MTDTADSLDTQLRQIDDYERKGLMRAEEAQAARAALQRRLMAAVLPDMPAPRLAWRTRLWAIAAMVLLVGGVAAYLLSGHAGLRRRSEEMLAAGRAAEARDTADRQARLARIRAGESLAPDANGVFHAGPPQAASTGAAAPSPAGSGADAVAPLLSGRVTLAPAIADQAAFDDAVFITVRLPDDPAGLPLAALRTEVGALPYRFDIGAAQLVGAPARFMQAPAVVVTARVSKKGTGFVRPDDLVGSTGPVAPWSGNVEIRIDHVVGQP